MTYTKPVLTYSQLSLLNKLSRQHKHFLEMLDRVANRDESEQSESLIVRLLDRAAQNEDELSNTLTAFGVTNVFDRRVWLPKA